MPGIDAESLELEEKLIQLKPVAKTVKGGRKRRFSALVVVGDGKGHVGAAIGKAVGVPDAIRKAGQKARTRLIHVPRNGSTIPYAVVGRVGAARVLLKPASPGTGVIAGGPVRAVVESAGIKDILTKCLGSDNATNCVWAALQGLMQLRGPEEVAQLRAIRVDRFPKYLRKLEEEGEKESEQILTTAKVTDNLTPEPDWVAEESGSDSESLGAETAAPDSDAFEYSSDQGNGG